MCGGLIPGKILMGPGAGFAPSPGGAFAMKKSKKFRESAFPFLKDPKGMLLEPALNPLAAMRQIVFGAPPSTNMQDPWSIDNPDPWEAGTSGGW